MMDTTETLTQFIVQELLKKTSDYQLAQDDNLLLSGLIDSLAIMRLVDFIAERFGYEVPPQDVTIENFSTIRILADYLKNKII
jgi:acyl carrier protein